MISVRDAHKLYGNVRALGGVSFDVERGSVFGVVGPDGAGKTTLLRMIVGVLSPSSGTVEARVGGDGGDSRRRIGYVAGKFSLYEDLSILENLTLFSRLYGMDAGRSSSRTRELLELTGLLPFGDRLAGRLSGGMKQKLAIAAAVLHEPELLVLDEPGTGVDPVSRRDIWSVLYRLNRGGVTIVVSTPYMDEAELCTRLVFLHEGRVLESGTPEEICGRFPHRILRVRTDVPETRRRLADFPSLSVSSFGRAARVVVDGSDADADARLREHLARAGITADVDAVPPTLEDVFVLAAESGRNVA